MRNTTIDGTEVAYHSDGFRDAQPAINVKHYALLNVREDRPLVPKLPPESGQRPDYVSPTLASLRAEFGAGWLEGERTNDGTDGAIYIATEDATRDWWEQAKEVARTYGLGDIEQEGRSGVWLVFTDGRDPQDMDDPGDCTYCDEIAERHDPDADHDFAAGDDRAEWLAAYSKMVTWCKATIDGGEVPQYRDTTPYTVGEIAEDPTVANVGPYTSEGIDADILYRLSDLAEQERERLAETLATRTFTEATLREAIEGYWGKETSAEHMAAAIFGGEDHAMTSILDKHHDWTEADDLAAKAVQS